MEDGIRLWANPSSPHVEGRKARAMLEDARERIKTALDWEGELIFTSGASEAAALALGRARGGQRMVCAVEHDCVMQAAPDALVIPVDGRGAVDGAVLESMLAGAPGAVVAVQSVNSETGNRQNLRDIRRIVQAGGGSLLVDAAQSAGKPGGSCAADMMIVSAHKFGGPVGIGALLVRDFAQLEPSGGHERGYRRGTENLPGALGMAAALEAAGERYADSAIFASAEALAQAVREAGGIWYSDRVEDPTRLIHAVAMPGLSGSAQVMRFDMAGIAVSQGSACSSGTMKPSRVLETMGVDRDAAGRTIRVSFGWNTTPAEVTRFTEAWLEMARAQA